MRITDLMLNNDFLNNFNTTKSKIDELQTQIATGNLIQKPSDSPDGTARLLGLNYQSSQIDTFNKNINSGLSFIQDTTSAMEGIQSEVANVMTTLSNTGNVAASTNLSNFADQIGASLDQILSFANTQSDGKYVFGGTDFSSEPFGYSADKSSVLVKAGNISGKQNIRTSPNTFQQINMPGTDVFGTIVSQNGSIDSSTAIGATVSSQTAVYDTSGTQYTLKIDYKKTAANEYTMSYDITDGGGNSVFNSPPAAKDLVFNPTSGSLQTVDGQSPSRFQIKADTANIDFTLDPTAIKEKSGTSNLSLSANQSMDIFNILLNIKNNLQNGIAPTDAQIKSVSDYNNHLLDSIAKAGNTINQMTDAQTLLNNQQTQIQSVTTSIQGVDMAKAIMDLQNQNTLLQYSYQLAAKITTKSLLDYL